MTEPGVRQLICTNSDISCNGQERCNLEVECPDRITSTGCTCNSVYDRSGCIKYMSKPSVRELVCADCDVSCDCQQWRNGEVKGSDRIATTGCTNYCIY